MKRMRDGKRTLAAFLAILMVLSLMPAAAFAEADDFTVNVTDAASSAPIEGATVVFKSGETELASAVSNASGAASFDSDNLAGADSCSVSAAGYQTNVFTVSDLSSPLSVQLTAIPAVEKVTVSGTVSDGTNPISGADVSLTGNENHSTTTDDTGAFSIADVTKTGEYTLTVSKSGYKTVSRTANLEESNTVVLAAKESVTLSFEQESVSVSMGSTVSNAVNNSNGRTVNYSSNNTAIATVDDNGLITPVSVGSTTITASCAENDDYLASTGSFAVTVTTGTQTVSFEKGTAPTLTIKDIRSGEAFSNTASASVGGSITYSVVGGGDLIEDFNSSTGSFKAVAAGTVTVEAVCVSDNYEEASAQYALTVSEAFDPTGIFTLQGTMGTVPWYVSDAYIVLSEGDGYTFFYANDELNTALGVPETGTDKLLVTNLETANEENTSGASEHHTPDGIMNIIKEEPPEIQFPVEFYIRRYDGAVVKTSLQETFYKDSKLPDAILTVEDKSDWTDQFLYIISFGTRNSTDAAVMTIEAKDDHSNIQSVQYYIDAAYDVAEYTTLTFAELSALPDENWTDYSTQIPLNPGQWTDSGEEVDTTKDAFFTAYAKITDVAGNVAFYNSEGIILDTKAPNVELRLDDGSEEGAELNDTEVYVNDVTLLVFANDYFTEEEETEEQEGSGEEETNTATTDAGLKTVSYWVTGTGITFPEGEAGHSEEDAIRLFKAQDSEIEGVTGVTKDDLVHEWKSTEDIASKIVLEQATFNGNCAIVHIKIVDRADNVAVYERALNFDTVAPDLGLVFDAKQPGGYKDGVPYFQPNRTITVRVVQNSASFDPKRVNINISGSASTYSIGAWTTVEGEQPHDDVHTAVITFAGDSEYTIEAAYAYGGEQLELHDYRESETSNVSHTFGVDGTAPTMTPNMTATNGGIPRYRTTTFYGTYYGDISGINTAFYLITTAPLSAEKVMASEDWIEATGDFTKRITLTTKEDYNPRISFTPVTLPTYYLYLKAIDHAGNVGYSVGGGLPPTVTVSPNAEPNANGYYNGEVKLDVTVTVDIGRTLQSANYEVFYGESETVQLSGTIQTSIKENGDYGGQITLAKKTVDNDEITVVVTATDDDSNVGTGSSIVLKIDPVAPTLNVSSSPTASETTTQYSYYNSETLGGNLNVIFRMEEDAARYSADDFTTAIDAKTASGAALENAVTIDENWTEAADGQSRTKTAQLTKNGVYTITASGQDLAGNSAEVTNNITGKIFIDTVAPTGQVIVNQVPNQSWLGRLIDAFFGKAAAFSAVANDEASGVKSVSYYTASSTMTPEQLANVNWNPLENNQIGADKTFLTLRDTQKAVVYIRVIDNAGNVAYFNTDNSGTDSTTIIDVRNPTVTVTAPNANANGFHIPVNGVVTVSAAVNDGTVSAGLKTVSYEIKAGETTETRPLFQAPENDTSTTELTNLSIPVDTSKFNADTVTVTVTATDNVGNSKSEDVELKICVTPPTINVKFENILAEGEEAIPSVMHENIEYFQNRRRAEVTVNCRPSAFGNTKPGDVIKVTIGDLSDNKPVPVSPSDWSQSGENYTATVNFPEGVFTFDVAFTSLAGLDATVNYENRPQNPNNFAVDLTSPTGTLKFGKLENLTALLETITFGLFEKEEITLKATASDEISPITKVAYYMNDGDLKLEENQTIEMFLDALDDDEWTTADISNPQEITLTTVSPDARAVPYVRITDASGRYSYLMTEGAIADATGSVITVAPTTAAQNKAVNGFFAGDIEMDYSVKERAEDEKHIYAGVQRVEWWTVVKDINGNVIPVAGEPTEDNPEILFDLFEGDKPDHVSLTKDQLRLLVENKLTVNAEKNNSNDVTVYVRTLDNAGNENIESTALKIDITNPQVNLEIAGGFSSGDVTGVITVKERNFDPARVVISATRDNQPITVTPSWTTAKGTGNGDDTTHTGLISFGGDGAYAITGVVVTDLAGNVGEASYAGAGAKTFTVDKTAPVLTVTYDNNDVTNDKYYKAARVATLTVTETNFDPETSKVEIQATDNGNAIAAPALSTWNSVGTTHTATVNFETDGYYTMSITIRDRSGNVITQTEPDFYVDTTMPTVEISGVDDQSANNTEDKIGIVLSATDTNFDVFVPKVVSVITDKDGKIVKGVVETGKITEIANGKVYTIEDLPDDGIYTVTVTVVDKAGNAYEKVTMIDAEGKHTEVAKTANDVLLTFSVNRKGSAYDLDENTHDLVGKYYVQHVYNDVVIIEVNADELQEYEVTVNGKALTADQDYKVEKTGGNGEWSKYIYTLPKELFEAEGEYSIVASSKDKAENAAFSDVKNAAVTFVVDRTAPIVAISGMESGGRYQTDRQTVTIIPTDDGGALASLFVALVNDRGETIKELINLSGKELVDAMALNNGIFTIELEEGLFQNVRVICKDCAVDDEGNVNTYDESFTEVSVSSSSFMIFWANRPLRYGVIGGVVGLLLILFLVLAKRRKKEEKKTAVK